MKIDLAKPKLGPHVEGVLGSINSNTTILLNQLQQFSLQSAYVTHTTLSMSPPQTLVVNVVKSLNPKGNQQYDGKNKGCGKKKDKGGKGNVNKPNEYTSEGKKEFRNKVKFPCKLCSHDHLTHLFPRFNMLNAFYPSKVLLVSNLFLLRIFPKGRNYLLE